MGEFLGILLYLAFFLAIVALIGHGIWVAVAWFFRMLTGDQPERRRPACPVCGSGGTGPDGCKVCGWPAKVSSQTRQANVLRAVERDLQRYRRAELIDADVLSRLSAVLQEVRDKPSPQLVAELVTAEAIEEASTTQPPVVGLADSAHPTQPAQPREAAARVQDYMARQAELARAPAPIEVVALKKPARPWSEIFKAFLEEKNIRWGELVGGLLIVCCSIALVISFWSAIAQRPLLKFFVFNGVTAGLFGVGFYALKRLKLPTTSQGLLSIATLLVPLNFLAIAAVSKDTAPTDALTIGGEVLSIAVFTALVYFAGRALAGPWPVAVVIGVMGSSIAQLLVRRFIEWDSGPAVLYGMAAIPLSCFIGSIGWALLRWPRSEDQPAIAHSLFRLLGLVGFAVLLPAGLLLVKSEAEVQTLRQLAPLVSLGGVPLLAVGLTLWRRMTDASLAAIRTAGTAIAVLGAFVWLAGIPLAWPDPARMLAVSLIGSVLFTAIGLRYSIPPAHMLAAASLSLAALLTTHVLRGEMGWQESDPGVVARALASAASGVALIPMSFLFAAAAGAVLRLNRRADAIYYGISAAGATAISLALVTWYGFGRNGDPSGATWVYAFYAILVSVAAAVTGRSRVAWCGSGLALAALVQGVVYRYAGAFEHPWQIALLAHATLTAVAAAARSSKLRLAFAQSGLITSVLACALILGQLPSAKAASLTIPLFWLAAAWLALACLLRWEPVFTAFQTALALAVVMAVTAQIEARYWFAWLDPWTLQTQAIALAILGLLWIGVRIFARRLTILQSPWLAVDRATNVVLLIVLIAVALYGAMPGVAQELTPRKLAIELSQAPAGTLTRVVPPLAAFEVIGIPHNHALGYGSWLLMGLLVAVFLAGQWQRYNPWRVFGVITALAMASPLLAGLWTPEVAAASALRWIAAIFLLAGSALIWFRQPLSRIPSLLGWPGWNERPAAKVSQESRTLLLSIVTLLLMAMAAYVALAAVLPGPIDADVREVLPILSIVFAVLATVSLALFWIPATIFADDWARDLWRTWSRQAALLLFILAAAPLVAVSLFVVTMALRGNPIVGPEPGTLFARIGLAVSYAVPILLIAFSLVGHAIRERSASFAFTAGLLFDTAATAGYLLSLGRTGAQLDAALWVRLAQLNALVAAVYTLCWLAAIRLRFRDLRSAPALLVTQAMLPVSLLALVLVPMSVSLWWNATNPTVANVAAGHWLGWLSLAMTLAAGVWLQRLGPAGKWMALAAVASLISMTLAPWDTGNWLSFHALLVGHTVMGGVLLALSIFDDRRSAATWSALSCLLAGLIAMRGAFQDPHGPWWSMGALGGAGAILAYAGGWALRQRFLYLAAVPLNLAASIFWIDKAWPTGPNAFINGMVELIEINALILALPVILWAAIELRIIRPALETANLRGRLPMHATAAFLSMLMLGGMVCLGLLGDLFENPLSPQVWLGWTALAVSLVALVACLWDVTLRMPVFGLYLLGLVAVGMTVDHFDLTPPRYLLWMGAIVTGTYALAASYLWSRREGLRQLGDALSIPRGPESPFKGLAWLVPANSLLIASVIVAAFWADLNFDDLAHRLILAKAAVFQVVSMGLLARGTHRSKLQTAALLVGVIGAVAWGWAWLEPGTTGTLLNRTVVVIASLAGMIVLYGLGLAKLMPAASEWTLAAKRFVPTLIGSAAVAMAFLLAAEVIYYQTNRGSVPMAPLAIFVVAAALLGLAVAAIAAAVLPGRDPLGLSERGRMLYVYAAEVILALLCLHIRLTRPEWFTGFISRYWTFIVVLISFLGVGLSEFFARRRQNVLAEPLERTGAFLPLLPVLGFWVYAGEAHYSLVLVGVGCLYTALAIMRKSFGFGVLAALSANGGLWYYLHHVTGLGLLEHPQLWFIPPAVCVLVAAHLNRDRLSVEQMTSIRYVTAMAIYVSSTADIFLNGVAEAPWLPLVLAGISLVGIFAGILLRVRAFLFLGTSFLVLALLTIIYHAAHDLDQTWVWSASGIVTGVLIIALFALFEKKRQEVLHLVDQLKEWD